MARLVGFRGGRLVWQFLGMFVIWGERTRRVGWLRWWLLLLLLLRLVVLVG